MRGGGYRRLEGGSGKEIVYCDVHVALPAIYHPLSYRDQDEGYT
jgi:hypothetical protein